MASPNFDLERGDAAQAVAAFQDLGNDQTNFETGR